MIRLSMPVVMLLCLVAFIDATLSGRQLKESSPVCDVTAPNGVVAGSNEPSPFSYGNKLLSVNGLTPNGTIVFRPGGAGFVRPDGALGMKFGWTRAVLGDIHVIGHRLDGDANPPEADVRCCYGKTGFQASYLIFPTPGCWEVVAQIGDVLESRLTFVTRVVKIGEGPVHLLRSE
jgi:hypothetical protein